MNADTHTDRFNWRIAFQIQLKWKPFHFHIFAHEKLNACKRANVRQTRMQPLQNAIFSICLSLHKHLCANELLSLCSHLFINKWTKTKLFATFVDLSHEHSNSLSWFTHEVSHLIRKRFSTENVRKVMWILYVINFLKPEICWFLENKEQLLKAWVLLQLQLFFSTKNVFL